MPETPTFPEITNSVRSEVISRALSHAAVDGAFVLLHVDENMRRSGAPCMAIITPIARIGIDDAIELPRNCVMEDYGKENALWEGGPSCYIQIEAPFYFDEDSVTWVDTSPTRSSAAWAIAVDRLRHGPI